MNQSDPVTVDRLKRNGSLPGDSPIPEGPEETLPITTFAPPVDIYEDEHTITLKLEVPRIDEKEIDVRIENNTLAGSITAGSITKGHDTVNVAYRAGESLEEEEPKMKR